MWEAGRMQVTAFYPIRGKPSKYGFGNQQGYLVNSLLGL